MKRIDSKRSGILRTLAGVTLVISMFAAMPAQATVILSDNFNSGAAGATLNGAAVQYYDSASYGSAPTWVTSTAAVYSATTTGVISSNLNGATSSIQGMATVSDKNSGIMTLQADVTIGNSDWIGIGFLNGTSWFGSNNTAFCILNTTGYITTFRNGNSAAANADLLGASIQTSGFNKLTTYNLKLVYDLDASTVSTYLDGVLRNTYALTGLNSSIINNVGFRFSNSAGATADSGRIDNFIYDYAAVPEPSTFALFTAAGLMGLVLNRRRLARL